MKALFVGTKDKRLDRQGDVAKSCLFWLVDKDLWWHLARGRVSGRSESACYQLGTWVRLSYETGLREKTTCHCVYVTHRERGISLFAQPVDGEKGLPRTSVARYYWLCYAQLMRDGRSVLQPTMSWQEGFCGREWIFVKRIWPYTINPKSKFLYVKMMWEGQKYRIHVIWLFFMALKTWK